MINSYKNIMDILEAQIMYLEAKQKALKEYSYNDNYCLKVRVIDSIIKNILSEIRRIEKLKRKKMI